MNDIVQKKHASIASLTGTTWSFLLTWRNKASGYPTTDKKNSINSSNVADWSMGFCAYNAIPANMNGCLRLALQTVGTMRRPTKFLSQLRSQKHG
ncbi:MAG: hypothetical protein ACI854_002343 [Arenicella sp.]|jgi:hypothetical protein